MKRRRLWFGAGLALVLIYCAIAVAAWFGRTAAIFPLARYPGAAPVLTILDPPIGLRNAELWRRQIGSDQADGAEPGAVAWYRPPPDRAVRSPAVVFFHGNAEVVGHQEALAQFYHARGFAVLMLEYRGYPGTAEVRPDFASIAGDALHVHDRLVRRPEIDRARIYAHGYSLGAAFATELAVRRPIAGLILQSTFTSIGRLAWERGLPGFLLGSDFDVASRLAVFPGATLIVHGTADELIPFGHAQRLATVARRAALVPIEGARHTLGIGDARVAAAIGQWLDAGSQER